MSGGSRGIVGRIWELMTGLLTTTTDIKTNTDKFTFTGDELKVTSTGGGGDLTPVIDELVELNSKVALDSTLDLVATEATLELIRQSVFNSGIDSKLLQVDSVGNTTYIGYAEPGTVTSAPTWAVKRIIESGQDVSITWANGDFNFDNIWDNRLTLIYS